ncbi:MAG TPA: methyltransferase domain-containing protein [Mycobacterium sp.]
MGADPVMTRDYILGQDFAQERQRLAGIEALWDPGSRALIEELGIGPGWKCLEVGAGGGSLVEWMADRGAHVTAIDIDTQHVEHLASDSITVRRIDIREQELPQSEFDLVHSRLVLEHLTERRQILGRLAETLRPGGWIVIEDYDWTCFGFDGDDDEGFSKATEAIMEFMGRAGFDRDYGRRVVADIADAGLSEVRGEGRVRILDSTSPGFDFFRLTFESLRGPLIDAGLLSAEEAETASSRFGRDLRVTTPVMMAGIGRRAP